ncbi:MAG: protein kinase [Chloroflexi bacterium]|nr:protein kinase [Chloroflexota bacterium]
MADLVGQTIRGYQFNSIIGSGGFGVVYRAFQPAVNREVAIKVMQPSRSQSEHFVKRFDAEAQVIAKLEHPYIVPLFDFWHDDERRACRYAGYAPDNLGDEKATGGNVG